MSPRRSIIRYVSLKSALLIGVAAVASISCAPNESKQRRAEAAKTVGPKQPEAQRDEAARIATERALAALASRHNAVRDWPKFPHKSATIPSFVTLEFQDAVQQLANKPAIAVCRIVDIYRHEQGFRFLCTFEPPASMEILSRARLPSVLFRLEVEEETARRIQKLLNEPPNPSDVLLYFGVVFSPSAVQVVHRQQLEAQGEVAEADRGKSFPMVDTWIKDSGVSPLIQITGRCHEIVYLDGYIPSQ